METKIYGASDDLIEIEGAISDEINCYNHKRPIKMTFSDGTVATIFYNDNGIWVIFIKNKGDLFEKIIKNIEPEYSDILVMNEGIEWVKIKSKKLYKQLNK